MKPFVFLTLLSIVLQLIAITHARKDAGDYWKMVMEDEPIPRALKYRLRAYPNLLTSEKNTNPTKQNKPLLLENAGSNIEKMSTEDSDSNFLQYNYSPSLDSKRERTPTEDSSNILQYNYPPSLDSKREKTSTEDGSDYFPYKYRDSKRVKKSTEDDSNFLQYSYPPLMDSKREKLLTEDGSNFLQYSYPPLMDSKREKMLTEGNSNALYHHSWSTPMDLKRE